ncbi:MAG: exodeoxyribonuclease VII large subunit [Spirochaetaceae bacterium]|nr:exodeoxyribonuclease VII large subunit [Spirochaetaceae bacterium]
MTELFPKDTTFSVSELTSYIKTSLEACFQSVIIEGEISNFKPSSSGHYYFTLKDENAAISAVLFKGKSRYLDFVPKDGMMVRVKGSVTVYALRGAYQIVVDTMEQAGTGDILKTIEMLKRKLADEGLFDQAKKRPLPRFPKTIGVITSPNGAALQDILNITQRRNNSISVVILPCIVQGNDAPPTIIRQIEAANKFDIADVLIVGRGGGSLEDLLPFSDEGVVRAVAASRIPIVSAVGHEIDTALSDYAADLRAPTPSAAAELVTPLKDDIYEFLQNSTAEMYEILTNRIAHGRLLLQSFSLEAMELHLRKMMSPLVQRFDTARDSLCGEMKSRITNAQNRLILAQHKLESANPQKILDRGFAIVRNKETGKIIRNADEVSENMVLAIRLAQGSVEAVSAGKTKKQTGENI